jgi:hypothetical protein
VQADAENTDVQGLSGGLWCKWHGPIGYAGGLNKPRSAMTKLKTVEELFKGRHFDRGIVILCERWYLRFKLSLRTWWR